MGALLAIRRFQTLAREPAQPQGSPPLYRRDPALRPPWPWPAHIAGWCALSTPFLTLTLRPLSELQGFPPAQRSVASEPWEHSGPLAVTHSRPALSPRCRAVPHLHSSPQMPPPSPRCAYFPFLSEVPASRVTEKTRR